MIRDWIKGILRELLDDDVKGMAFNYVEQKVGETIQTEIKEALAPAIEQIKELNDVIEGQIKEISESIDADIIELKEKAQEGLSKVVETLPDKLAELELDVTEITDHLNEKVTKVLKDEIYKANTYGGNIVVNKAKEQFNEFVDQFDFLESIRKK